MFPRLCRGVTVPGSIVLNPCCSCVASSSKLWCQIYHFTPWTILCVGFNGQGMPDDIAGGYDPVGDMWVSSEDSDTEIKAGCGVRLRIIGVTVGAELVRTCSTKYFRFFLPSSRTVAMSNHKISSFEKDTTEAYSDALSCELCFLFCPCL